MKTFAGIAGALVVVLAALVWVFRPFVHGLVMIPYKSPLMALFALLALALAAILGMRLAYMKDQAGEGQGSVARWFAERKNLALLGGTVLAALFVAAISPWLLALAALTFIPTVGKTRLLRKTGILVVLAMVATGVLLILESELQHRIVSQRVAFAERAAFPQVDPVRIQPKIVSDRYANDSLQNSQETLGEAEVVLVDGKQVRVYPRFPDGGLLTFLNKLSGFITVDVSTLDKNAAIKDQRFEYAAQLAVFDNLSYRLLKEKYFVEYADPVYLKDPASGQWVTVVPYVRYEGFPIRTPVWGGFMTVEGDGTIADHAPEEAATLALTRGNSVFPDWLARYYAESYAYRDGLLNVWFYHRDQPLIDEVDYASQPFHLATREGYKQVLVAKPYSNSYGMFKIFVFDATTGKPEIISFGQDSLLTGPVASLEYVQKAFPSIDYSSFSVVEPRPVMFGDEFYWLSSIASNSGAGIAKTVALNARTNEVIELSGDEQIRAFVEGDTLPDVAASSTPALGTDEQVRAAIERIERELAGLKELLGR